MLLMNTNIQSFILNPADNVEYLFLSVYIIVTLSGEQTNLVTMSFI